MPGIDSVDNHMNNGSGMMAVFILHLQALHQLPVACRHHMAVYPCGHAVAADFLNIRHSGPVNGLSVRLLQAFADGMRGSALCKGRIFQQLFLFHLIVVNRIDFKDSFRQRTGLVKYHTSGPGHGLQIIGPFDQNSCIAGSSDSRKKTQRDADHQRTGTADHQESQCTVDPVSKIRRKPQHGHPHQRRQKGKRQGAAADQRRVDPCKF